MKLYEVKILGDAYKVEKVVFDHIKKQAATIKKQAAEIDILKEKTYDKR